MFGFLKKLFGGDVETNKEVGVQIGQASAPYKVPEPQPATPIPPVVDKVIEVNSQPIVKETKPAAIKAPKKPAAKKAAPKKEAAKKPASNRGRKPKAK
jgi:hypothetical protein